MTNAIEEAREALGAFVDRPWMKCLSDDLSENHLISMDVRVADLRRASRALAALSAPAPSGLTDEGLGLAHQTPMQDVEIEYWLNQADNYAEVSIPCDDLRSLIARAISPAPSIDWKRVEEVRKRADELERLGHLAYHDWASEAHADRAFLLSLLPKQEG
jgi:hypothetical protein